MSNLPEITENSFGHLSDGSEVRLYTLTSGNNCAVKLTNYGATIVSICTPDQLGIIGDIALGYDDIAGYEADNCSIGTTVGRYANRIARGALEIDGHSFQLACNNEPNHLHGGNKGFNRHIWKCKSFSDDHSVGVVLSHHSPDGDEGYPGNLEVIQTITLFSDNRLRFEFEATTDQATIINLTNHSYFNLAGQGTILDHQVQIHAEHYLPVDETSIPLDALEAVAGTAFDFRHSVAVGDRLSVKNEQLKSSKGFDHTFVLSDHRRELTKAATVIHPHSGRMVVLSTTEPGVQFYTGNFLDNVAGRNGETYAPYAGLCLEPQLYPDSPNRPDFPSALLIPGQVYRHVSEYKFSTIGQAV